MCTLFLLASLLITQTSAPVPDRGLSLLDLDSDGVKDLALVDAAGNLRLLRNAGKGDFEELADRGGLPARVGALHWFDIDGDGDLDALILDAAEGGGGARLYECLGPVVFAEFEGAFGLAALDTQGCPHWLDFDGDDLTDLLWSAPESVLFLRQVRRGAFEVTSKLGVDAGPPAPAATVTASASSATPLSTNVYTGPAAMAGTTGLVCTDKIVDRATNNCVHASSVPILGDLYPLSTNFNLDSAGRVGLGTTSPTERLDVAGRVRAQAGVRFGDGSVQTSAGTRDWNALVNVPAGFADGTDDDTTYGAGAGLALSGTTFSVASGGVSAAQLALDAASLAKVTGGAAAMVAGALLVNTGTPAGRVRIRHGSSTASPHLMLTQDGASAFARLGMDNPLSAQSWTIAGSLTAAAATDRLNFFHSTGGDVLSVGGNNRVGINTTSPLASLHVIGGLHLQGSAADITVPPAESLQLGHFNGTTFTPRLTLQANGETVTSGGLYVDGELRITNTTRWLALSGGAFRPDLQMFTSGDVLAAETGSSFATTCSGAANLSLPHGARITSVAARFLDTSPTRDLTLTIYRRAFSQGSANYEQIAAVASSGAPGIQISATTSLANNVIDNENFMYVVIAQTLSPAQPTQSLYLFGVRVGYDITSPLP